MSIWRENYVCSLRTTSIWKEILLEANTVYGPDKKDVVLVTEIISQRSVTIVIAELNYKDYYTTALVHTTQALLCPERSWK